MKNILEKRIVFFKNNFDIDQLHSNFNITHAKISIQFIDTHVNTLKIQFNKYKNKSAIQYISKNNLGNRIPTELTNKIITYIYCHTYIHLDINIDFREFYPFHNPIWRLNKMNSNIGLENKECEKVIQSHNEEYLNYWNPSSQLEMEILSLFVEFNHFEKLLN